MVKKGYNIAKGKLVKVTYDIPLTFLDFVNEYAEKNSIPKSAVVRNAIKDFMIKVNTTPSEHDILVKHLLEIKTLLSKKRKKV
ncbi:MAG: hypothetical protein ACE5HR_00375 [bacterium]